MREGGKGRKQQEKKLENCFVDPCRWCRVVRTTEELISPICLLVHGHTQLANIPHNTLQIGPADSLVSNTFSGSSTDVVSFHFAILLHNTRQIETIHYLLPATFSRRFTGVPSCCINYCWCVIPHTTFIPILSCDRPQLANMSHNTLHTKTINSLVSDTFAQNFH